MKLSRSHSNPAALILWVAFAVLYLSSTGYARQEVMRVVDGDTVLLNDGTCVRYLGIDTPEMDDDSGHSEWMAKEARDANKRLVEGRPVKLEYDQEQRDGHGRHLAYVFLANGEMVNALLVRMGLAYVMSVRPNLKYRELLIERQREAMAEGAGRWKSLSKAQGLRIGNRRSYRFHRPDCPFGKKTLKENRIRFRSRFEAFWEGYAPCRRCRP